MRARHMAWTAPLVVALLASAAPAKADFWSDAGKPYEGVIIHGVSESTPPSNYVKDVLGPAHTHGVYWLTPAMVAATAIILLASGRSTKAAM